MKIRTALAPVSLVGFVLGLVGPSSVTAAYIDSINPNAVPAANSYIGPDGTFTNLGWYYTPNQDYSLTGIASYFAPFSSGTGSRTITFQIQTDRPVNGGSILGQGGIVADSAFGGVVGVTFAPVQLTAGTTYFVDILNIGGMGLNIGQWADVGGTHVATVGATTRLPAFYFNSVGETGFASSLAGDAADAILENNAHVSGIEPILFFSGTQPVPEPASVILMGLGSLGIVGYFCGWPRLKQAVRHGCGS